MTHNFSGVNALILDFGGVIYTISHEQQAATFLKMGIGNFARLYSHALQDPLFKDLECGKIEEGFFKNELRQRFGIKLSDREIDLAWNSILVGFPEENVRFLEMLGKKYRLYLLSNTNAIHYKVFINDFFDRFGYDFNSLFEKTFWSFQIGKRKPNPDIYHYVMKETSLNPENTRFVDDTKINAEAAEKNGMPAIWLAPGKKLKDIFDENLKLRL